MLTAIILVTALVIAVVMYAMCRVSSECARIEESAEWARKWNEQRAKEENYIFCCDNNCKECGENDYCFFSEV